MLVPRLAKSGWPGGFGNILNLYCWSLLPSNGVLYLGTFDASSFPSLLLPGIGLADAALSDNDAGLKETVGAPEKLGLDKYYAPCRQFVAAPVARDLAAPDSGLAQDSPLNSFFSAALWKTSERIAVQGTQASVGLDLFRLANFTPPVRRYGRRIHRSRVASNQIMFWSRSNPIRKEHDDVEMPRT